MWWLKPSLLLPVGIGALVCLIIIAIWGDRWLKAIIYWKFIKLHKDKAVILKLQVREQAELGNYLYCGIERIDYSCLKELNHILVIHLWFVNASVLAVDHKQFDKFEVRCNGNPLPKPESIPFQKILAGRTNTYPFKFAISQEFVANLEKCAKGCEFVEWSISLDWVFSYGKDSTTHLKRRDIKHRGVPEIL